MAENRNIFKKIVSLLQKEKNDFGGSINLVSPTETPQEEKPDLLETQLAEANHDVSDFTNGLNASRSPIATSPHSELNGSRFLAAHLVGFKDTLSGITYKYYGKASEPYYRLIYEANQELIGPNMNLLRAGQTLNIPKLPEDLSTKEENK